jgi:hypothetical protein
MIGRKTHRIQICATEEKGTGLKEQRECSCLAV